MIRSNSFRIIIGIVVFIALGIMLFCAINIDIMEKYDKDSNEVFEAKITVNLPDKIYVVNEAVVEWMNGTDTAKIVHDKYRDYGRLDFTNALDFFYTIEDLPVNCVVENQKISIVDKDYSKEVYAQELSPEKRSATIENLRPDTTYEYSVQVTFSNGKFIEKKGEFTTEASPCFLFVDGARNVRDIGTAKTIDGKQIKKYMVYRGVELDGAIEPKYHITQNGIDYMVNTLNIKSEMDLRWYDENLMKDVLGNDIYHNYYPISAYNDFFDTSHSVNNSRKLFSDLANPDVYPIYLHCSYGADRTGTVIYVLQALLGVDEETLYQELECSVFCNGDTFYEEMDEFLIRFKKLKGDTMQEKAENYLLSIGVTRKEIESIKEILLED